MLEKILDFLLTGLSIYVGDVVANVVKPGRFFRNKLIFIISLILFSIWAYFGMKIFLYENLTSLIQSAFTHTIQNPSAHVENTFRNIFSVVLGLAGGTWLSLSPLGWLLRNYKLEQKA